MNLPSYTETDQYITLETSWNLAAISALPAWAETEGQSPVIAVVDTGLDLAHPALAGRIVNPTNVTSDGPPSDVTDYRGHGTHVAGIALGVYGGSCRIMPVKAFAKSPTGWEFQDAFSKIKAYNKGVYEKDRIVAVNCSWGGGYDAVLNYQIRELVNSGVAVICSAGNAGGGKADTSEIFNMPAFLQEVITVGALDESHYPAFYSSSYDGIDLAAPGTNVYSLWPDGGYKILSGTSMAAPHVTAAYARIAAAFRNREGRYPTTAEGEAILWKHIRWLGLPKELVGRGLLDLTYSRKRWPSWRAQSGSFFFESNADKVITTLKALNLERPELGLSTPYKTKYLSC